MKRFAFADVGEPRVPEMIAAQGVHLVQSRIASPAFDFDCQTDADGSWEARQPIPSYANVVGEVRPLCCS